MCSIYLLSERESFIDVRVSNESQLNLAVTRDWDNTWRTLYSHVILVGCNQMHFRLFIDDTGTGEKVTKELAAC